MKLKIVILFFTIFIYINLSSMLLSMDRLKYNLSKKELKDYLTTVACTKGQDHDSQVKLFGNRIIELFGTLKRRNGSGKINLGDITFADDTVYTLFAKNCCRKKNCLACLKKFYFLLKVPEDNVGSKSICLKCKDDKTLFSIACQRGLLYILSFIISQCAVRHLDIFKSDKRCLSKNKDLLEKLLDKSLFDELKNENCGIKIDSPYFVNDITDNYKSLGDIDTYVKYLESIIKFYVMSGIHFDYKIVKLKINDLIFKTNADLEKLKKSDHEWENSEGDIHSDEIIKIALKIDCYSPINNDYKMMLRSIQILNCKLYNIHKFYDVQIVTEI